MGEGRELKPAAGRDQVFKLLIDVGKLVLDLAEELQGGATLAGCFGARSGPGHAKARMSSFMNLVGDLFGESQGFTPVDKVARRLCRCGGPAVTVTYASVEQPAVSG